MYDNTSRWKASCWSFLQITPILKKSIYKQPNPGKDEEHLESHQTNLVLLEFEESTSLSY